MAYEARRNNNSGGNSQGKEMTEDERNIKNNTENLRNAADVAMATKNPCAMAAGAAVKAADKLTGGKSTEALGKVLNQANKTAPGGKQLQKGLNKINESGIGDKVGQAARMKNQMGGGGGGAAGGAQAASANAQKAQQVADKAQQVEKAAENMPQKSSESESSEESSSKKSPFSKPSFGIGSFFANLTFEQKIVVIMIPVMAITFLFVGIFGAAASTSGEFEEAFGAAEATGGDTGGIPYSSINPEARDFYDRLNKLKLNYQSRGKTVDVIKVVAVYHVLNTNNLKYDYDYMTMNRLEKIADSMFSGNIYSEATFKTNLTDDIFKAYFPRSTKEQREKYTRDVFNYIKNYNEIIGNKGSMCAASGTCTYAIKGFKINNNTVTKQMNINNLMVRLLQCGGDYGEGDYNTPINQELVPFEEYAAGVAYAEVGPGANIEVLKAQIVMARSFALARPTAMGNARSLKLEEENGKWILQISSCVADQVFCNINEGCTYTGGGDGQGGYVISGIHPEQSSGEFQPRQPLEENHPIRIALSQTLGEVLVDENGYIISTGYTSVVQNKLADMANKNYNYKQMLLEVYGAYDIAKMTCNKGSDSACGMVSTGPFATWKQYEGPWVGVPMGTSGRTLKEIGCLVTSVSMLIAKSGVETVIEGDFNPGTFVQFLNANGGIDSGGNFYWHVATKAAPSFKYMGQIGVSGQSRTQKLNQIKDLLNAGYYVVAEVKGPTGQHWVAIDAVQGDNIVMMDPGSSSNNMWERYPWSNTSTLAYYQVA